MNIRRQALRRRRLRNNRYINSRTIIDVIFMKASALAFKRWMDALIEHNQKIYGKFWGEVVARHTSIPLLAIKGPQP